MASGARTREYLTVQRNTDTIIRSLAAQVDPGLFAQKLCDVDLVTPDVLERARVREVTPSNRVQHVISAVQSQIDLESSQFDTFMHVLEDVHPLLAKKLKEYFCKFIHGYTCYRMIVYLISITHSHQPRAQCSQGSISCT